MGGGPGGSSRGWTMYSKHVVHATIFAETEKRLGCVLFLLYLSLYLCWSGRCMHFGKIMLVASSRKRNFYPLIHCAGDIFACHVESIWPEMQCRKLNILFCRYGLWWVCKTKITGSTSLLASKFHSKVYSIWDCLCRISTYKVHFLWIVFSCDQWWANWQIPILSRYLLSDLEKRVYQITEQFKISNRQNTENCCKNIL